MKRKYITFVAACCLALAALCPADASEGSTVKDMPDKAAPRVQKSAAANASGVLESLYTHISEEAKKEVPPLRTSSMSPAPEDRKARLSALSEKAVKEHPDRFEAYVFRGNMYFLEGEKEKCFADMDHAVSLAPENPLAYGARAEVYARSGQKDQALKDWDKALSLNPADQVKDHIYFQRGFFYMARKQYREAISDFQKDMNYISPNLRFVLHMALGDCYAGIGSTAEAEREYKEATLERPDQPIVWEAAGDFYSGSMKAYDRAKECYDRALSLSPQSEQLLRSAGMNASRMNRNQEAVDFFTKAVEEAPAHWRNYSLRAGAYAAMEQYKQAAEDFTKAIELKDGPNEILHILRGHCYQKLGRYDKAMADYTAAAALDPQDAESYESMGYIHSLRGEYDEAIPCYEKAISLDPKNGEACNNLGYTWFQKGNTDKALEYLNKAIEADPSYAESYRSRAEVYSTLGQPDKALADMDRFIALSPDDADGYTFRAKIYDQAGKKELAEQDRKKAKEMK